MEQRTRILGRLSECFTDYRDPDRIEHSVEALIKQRVLGLCLGYEDLNDHDELCRDRLLALLCDRDDLTGEFRRVESDRGKPLAGKSTLNRLERTPLEGPEGAYKKIVADPAGMDELLLEVFVEAHPEPPEEVILDVDATDDPLHGKQEGRFFHGYYKRYCYLPLYVFCGEHGLACAAPHVGSRRDPRGGAGAEADREAVAGGLAPGADRGPRGQWIRQRRVDGLVREGRDRLRPGVGAERSAEAEDRDPDGDRPEVAAGDGQGREAVPGTALSDAQELVLRAPGGGESGALAPGKEPAVHRDIGPGPGMRWAQIVRGGLLRARRHGEPDQGCARLTGVSAAGESPAGRKG